MDVILVSCKYIVNIFRGYFLSYIVNFWINLVLIDLVWWFLLIWVDWFGGIWFNYWKWVYVNKFFEGGILWFESVKI